MLTSVFHNERIMEYIVRTVMKNGHTPSSTSNESACSSSHRWSSARAIRPRPLCNTPPSFGESGSIDIAMFDLTRYVEGLGRATPTWIL